jgi:hypothetical protein
MSKDDHLKAAFVGPPQTAISCWSRWVLVGSSPVMRQPVALGSPRSDSDSDEEAPPPRRPPRRRRRRGPGPLILGRQVPALPEPLAILPATRGQQWSDAEDQHLRRLMADNLAPGGMWRSSWQACRWSRVDQGRSRTAGACCSRKSERSPCPIGRGAGRRSVRPWPSAPRADVDWCFEWLRVGLARVWFLEEFRHCQGMPKRRGCHFLRASYQILRRKLANRVSPPLARARRFRKMIDIAFGPSPAGIPRCSR